MKSEIKDYFYLSAVLVLGLVVTFGLFFSTLYMEYRSERKNMQVTNVNFSSAIEYMTTNQIFRLQNLEQELFYAGGGSSSSLLGDRFNGWIRAGYARYAGLVSVKSNGEIKPLRFNSRPDGRKVFGEIAKESGFREAITAVSREGSNHFSLLHVSGPDAYIISFRFLANKRQALILVQEASKVFNRLSPLASRILILEQKLNQKSEFFELKREKDVTVVERVSPDKVAEIFEQSRAQVSDPLGVFGTSGKVYSVMRSSAKNELVMPWVVLLSGIIITSLLGVLVFSLINRNIQIQQLVKQKTIGLEIESQKAKEAAISKGKFVANVSHEVRTPLNLILGMADLLSETKLDTDQKEYVECFRQAGSHLMRLIDDVLDIVKSDLNDVKIRIQWVQLAGLADEIIRFFEPLCESKGLFFQCDVDPRLPEKFLSDPSRIRQIVINLLNNAIKFTEHGYVRLSFRMNEGPDRASFPLIISVVDSGLGIPQSMKQSIFEEFVQVDDSSKRSRGGVGLGLSIVKALLNKLGGRVEVESVENAGSTFRVYLQGRFENERAWVKSLTGPLYQNALYVTSEVFERPGLDRLMHYVSTQSFIKSAADVPSQLNIFPNLKYDLVIVEDYNEAKIELLDRVRKYLKKDGTILLIGLSGSSISIPAVTSENVKTCISPISTSQILKKLGYAEVSKKQNLKDAANQLAVEKNWNEDLKNVKLLIAEDDPSNRFLIEAYLKNYPVQVDYASNGKEAMEMFEKSHHDIIVTDLHMPVMDGYELIRKVRFDERSKRTRDNKGEVTPIIVLTADVQDSSIKKVKENGHVSFISKPVSKTRLLEAVHRALDLT